MTERPMIIVAEAEDTVRESIEMILIDEGYDCHAVADSQALLRAIHLHDCDLIIADITFVYRNIESILSALHNYSSSPPPILVTLSYERIRDMLHLVKFGVTEYLIKPFNFDQMLYRVSKMTDTRSPLQLK